MAELDAEPAINDRTFSLLRAEIHDDKACATFVQMYLDLLPGRLSELTHALSNGDVRPWEAAMNLASTSRMLGALPLARHLERLSHDSILTESPEAMRVYLRQLFELVKLVQPALRRRVRALTAPGDIGDSLGRSR